MTVIYAAIGNSDDKLTQEQWSKFVTQFVALVRRHADRVYGEWYSAPDAPFQNACMGFAVDTEPELLALREELTSLRTMYRQESAAWAVVDRTEFV